MQLSCAIQKQEIKERSAQQVMEVLESFLVRRAVCGHESTGLHAVFKRLWADCDGKPSAESVVKAIKKHRTVIWPNAESLKSAVQERPLYNVGVTKYVILEYDRSLTGDQPADVSWIEHVLPENPHRNWFKDFTKAQHRDQKDLLAKLIPLSQEMNIKLSNKPYPEKRKKFLADAMFKSARTFTEFYARWTPEMLEKRGKDLATWTAKRWPH